jgi:Ser/Thr protein kinase RdoA (MazF antagonist)
MSLDTLIRRSSLPCPVVTLEQARELLVTHYGLTGALKELGSHQDRNVLVESESPVDTLGLVEEGATALRPENMSRRLRHRRTGRPACSAAALGGGFAGEGAGRHPDD